MGFQAVVLHRSISHQKHDHVTGSIGITARYFLAVNASSELLLKIGARFTGRDQTDIGNKMPLAKLLGDDLFKVGRNLRARQ